MPSLRCPAEHRGTDPAVLVQVADRLPDDQRVIMTIVEGQCPACPMERLEPEEQTRYGESVWFGRCPCCGAAWRTDTETWQCLPEGSRLIETP